MKYDKRGLIKVHLAIIIYVKYPMHCINEM